ncbi:diguanylate cyclase (GGDEF) domain-containing protein [Pseudomonas cuatrocienegasensis]|uniref:Diguanylate cyclase (GGDEF) domain-containing protein n=1 Tax=Pseudomonas cuatrocienegasensis TaxID=543360 RepID=A0ABY1B800_9PSED|nr:MULTISPECIES: diguanylate cyclase [Pseudomonas]OEC33879.1 hypothetical protein A7D25_16600 [Pseudomonas sp. 21C1]SEQ19058.1 diguanylate cyclase (GGDEF) domain-containing protein [Pseudomonas cuatrocienegasensis]
MIAIAYLSLFVVAGAIWGSRVDRLDGQRAEALHASLYNLANTLSLLKDAETGQRGYLLTGDPDYLEPYDRAVQRLEKQFSQLRESPALQAYDTDLMVTERLVRLRMAELRETIDQYQMLGAQSARQRVRDNEGRLYMRELRWRIKALEEGVSQELEALRASSNTRTHIAFWGGGTVALLMLALLGLVYRELRRDLRDRDELLARLEYESQHDALTQLPNRRAFNDQLDQALALARRADRQVTLMYLDLDGFKPINDAYGHSMGDQVLKATAQRWRALVREGEVLARLGGDEFAVIAEGEPAALESLATRMIAALDAPVFDEMPALRVSVSIGMAQFPRHGEDGRRLLAAADTAMYRAKAAGKHCFVWPPASSAASAPLLTATD